MVTTAAAGGFWQKNSGSSVFLLQTNGGNIINKRTGAVLAKTGNVVVSSTRIVGQDTVGFDGAGGYLTGSVAGLPTSQDFTIRGWVRFAATPNFPIILSTRNSGTRGILLGIDTNGSLAMHAGNGSAWASIASPANAIPRNDTKFFQVNREATILKMYVGGVQVASGSISHSIVHDTLTVGRDLGNPNAGSNIYMNGNVIDLEITSGLVLPVMVPDTPIV